MGDVCDYLIVLVLFIYFSDDDNLCTLLYSKQPWIFMQGYTLFLLCIVS